MEEDLHLLRQQALRTLPSPKKRAIAPGLLPHRPTSHQLESNFRTDGLLFREKIERLPRRKHLSSPELSRKDFSKGGQIGLPTGRKRPHQARPLVHAKRRKQSTSDSSSHSAYSSSSQSRSASQSSYSSSRSSSPSHSRSSRSSSHSSHSRSLSSRQSSSSSRSSFSSSSRSPSASPKPKSKTARMTRNLHLKAHRNLDRNTPSNAKKLRSPPLIPNKNWQTNSLEYKKCKQREDDAHRRRILPQENFPLEHSYRSARRSRSPAHLGDKFVERSRRQGHYGHESPRRYHPLHSPPRERRVIRQVRRSPPPIENDRYSRGRIRPTYSPPPLRHRTKFSPPPQMRRRPRMHSLERPRRPVERSGLGREERYKRLPDTKQRSGRRDESMGFGDGYRSFSKASREIGSHSGRGSMANRRVGRSESDPDQEVKKRVDEKKEFGIKRDRKASTGDAKNGECKSKEHEPVEKDTGITTEEHDLLQTEFETSDLLGDYEFNVELDYDENMDELDAVERPEIDSDHKDNASEINDLQNISTGHSRSSTPEVVGHVSPPSGEESKVDEDVGGEKISSPIRVSPDRDRDRSRRGKESGSKISIDGKLSVKERLYVSRQTIEDKRRAATKSESQSSLRPSLASRLGPSPQSRQRSDDFPKNQRVSTSRSLNKSSKGDAVAIAEAYRRRKRQEAVGLHKDEVQKAKKFTKIINEHGRSKTSKRTRILEDVENGGDREKALDKRIDAIKEQNRAIMKRNKEIEEDKELYG